MQPLESVAAPAEDVAALPPAHAPTATRRDLQLGRRAFHLLNGVSVATAYALFFTHAQLVHVFGTIACLAYIADRIRIHYPEALERLPWLNRLFFRAEERMKESAMIPYAIAVLLTILTFPKTIALIAIYTLGIADPLAAVVGIRWGTREVAPDRSIEGMTAYFVAVLVIAATVLTCTVAVEPPRVFGAALVIACATVAYEFVRLRVDDNLTIPLVVGFTAWITCAAAGVPLG